jgi:carboxypeptidase C (cathepsin A)
LVLSLAAVIASAFAQFPPPSSYSTVIKSPINSNITISYKQPDAGTCTTVFSTQKQYTGYISLPPSTLAPIQQNYPINTFFWFVEARQQPETAPLTIWLNGGPGSSSLIGFFQENGPCEVVQVADGSYGTQSRMWGWDRSSNVLFIDQPAQVGFSYDVATNFSWKAIDGSFNPPGPVPNGVPPYAWLNGTFGSQKQSQTSNTTTIAAHAIWHFLQGWLSAFPQYNPGTQPNSTLTYPTGVNLFTESYGGRYGPAFARLFENMNEMRRNGTISKNTTLEIDLVSVGIGNGLVDNKIQMPYYPKFAFNNTYGIQAIGATTMYNAINQLRAQGGCLDLIDRCRVGLNVIDPEADGDNGSDVSGGYYTLCSNAITTCNGIVNTFSASGLDVYDIRQKDPSPFPSEAYVEYLNTGQVMKAIGVPVNYTESSNAAFGSFDNTGDQMRGGGVDDLAYLLAMNIRVALISGDADYIVNWYGGEAISLAVANELPPYAINFPTAGYADIVINSTYVGGQVRQYGNLSFARIYDAGHEVPAYQPETAFTIFTRIIEGTAVSTGEEINLNNYRTSGPSNSTHSNKAGTSANPVCYIRAMQATCTSDQISQIVAGKGVVLNGVWYSDRSQYTAPASTIVAGKPGTPVPSATGASMMSGSSTIEPTGVYTATFTPKPTSAAQRHSTNHLAWILPFAYFVLFV